MAVPCGAIIYYLATVTGLTGLATYYGRTSESLAPADQPLSEHIVPVATKTVQAVFNTLEPTVYDTLQNPVPRPELSYVLSFGESVASFGNDSVSSYIPFWSLPALLAGLLCVSLSLMLLYICSDFYCATRDRASEIVAVRLAEWNSYSDDELEKRKANLSDGIGKLEDEYSAAKRNHDTKMAELTKTNEDEYSTEKRNHDTRMAGLKQANEDEYFREKRNHDTKMAELRKANEDEYSTAKHDHDTKMAELKKANEDEYSTEKRNHDTKMAELREKNAAEKNQLEQDHSTEIINMKDAHVAEKEKLTKDHSDAMNKLGREHSEEMAELGKQNAARVKKLTMDHYVNVANLKGSHTTEINEVRNEVRKGSSAVPKSLSPGAATFTPAAHRSAEASNASSTNQLNGTEITHKDAPTLQVIDTFDEQQPQVDKAAPKHAVGSAATSTPRFSTKGVDKAEKSQSMNGSNMFAVLADEETEMDDQEALADLNTTANMQLGSSGSMDNNTIESSRPAAQAPIGSFNMSMHAPGNGQGWTAGQPWNRVRTSRGRGKNGKGRPIKNKPPFSQS